jgi:hypothetical protein
MSKLGTKAKGGKRAGAGRPCTTLIELVRSRSFSAENWRHRRLLETEDLPADELGLLDLQRWYRQKRSCGCGPSLRWIAQSFEVHTKDRAP